MRASIKRGPMKYETLAESIRRNGDRHKARGDIYSILGLLAYAAGSYRKAFRNWERADLLERFPI